METQTEKQPSVKNQINGVRKFLTGKGVENHNDQMKILIQFARRRGYTEDKRLASCAVIAQENFEHFVKFTKAFKSKILKGTYQPYTPKENE